MDKNNSANVQEPKSEKEISDAMGEVYHEADQELLYSLKSTIDRSGRYKFKLEDFSLGYAAGAGMSGRAAKREISDKFEKQFGLSPKQYLERSFEQNRTNHRSQVRQNENAKEKDFSRER